MGGWNTGNNWILYINENVTDQQIADSKKQLAEAKESPALGFIFNTDNVKSEGAYEKVLNEMQKQYDEFLKNKKS